MPKLMQQSEISLLAKIEHLKDLLDDCYRYVKDKDHELAARIRLETWVNPIQTNDTSK